MDHNFQSLHQTIAPVVLCRLGDQDHGACSVLVRLRPEGIRESLELLGETWEEMVPERPFEYSFMDDDIQEQYAAEGGWYRIVLGAAALAVLIACLGLLGLSSLAATSRSREIGIRKVLGSSVPRVLLLLVGDAGRLVVVASLAAGPLSYLAMRQWLEAFAYRVDLSVVTFASVAFGILALATLTTGFQVLKGARPKPLRDGGPKHSGLFLGVAVGHHVICVAFEQAARILPGQPQVERVVQELLSCARRVAVAVLISKLYPYTCRATPARSSRTTQS